MKKWRSYLYVFLVSFFFINQHDLIAQSEECDPFENGSFTARVDEPTEIIWTIFRDGNEQQEIFEQKSGNGHYITQKTYGLIDWIDECSYIFTYDPLKSDLTETEIAINEVGGILVVLGGKEGNCIGFVSYLLNEFSENEASNEIVIEGVICKNDP